MLYLLNKTSIDITIQKSLRKHSAVVYNSAINNSLRFNRRKIVNTQRNTLKRKIAESLLINNHLIADGNKSSFHLSIIGAVGARSYIACVSLVCRSYITAYGS